MILLYEDPERVQQIAAWVGDFHGYVAQLVDANGTPVDVTTGTLAGTFTNIATGAAYTFPSGTTTFTKSFATEGIVTILNPAAYPTSAKVRLTISFTVSSVVRRFGPLEIEILAP